MVCGCSLWMNLASCCGSAFCSVSKLASSEPSVFTSRSTSFLGVLRAEGVHQHFLGVIDAALEDVVVGHRHLVELFEHRLGLFVADGSDARHLVADDLHFLFVHLPQDLAADLIAEDDHAEWRLCGCRVHWQCR